MVGLKKRIAGSTLIETIIAVTIILVVFAIASMIFVRINSQSVHKQSVVAVLYTNHLIANAQQTGLLEVGEDKYLNLTFKTELIDIDNKLYKQMTITVFNTKKKKIYSKTVIVKINQVNH